jgi:hypothetical protein
MLTGFVGQSIGHPNPDHDQQIAPIVGLADYRHALASKSERPAFA